MEEEEEGEGEEGEEGGEEARRVSKEWHLWLKSRDPRLAGGEQTQATRYKQLFFLTNPTRILQGISRSG